MLLWFDPCSQARKPRPVFRLFPSLRRSLLNEGKTAKYLKYAFGDVLLVVAKLCSEEGPIGPYTAITPYKPI